MIHQRLPNGIDLVVFPTKKFSTATIKGYFFRPLAEETVTKGALLPMVLKRGTRHHPTQQQLAAHLEDLWGAEIEGDVSKLGDYHVTDLVLETVDRRFLPTGENTLLKGFELLAELITDPSLEGEGFVSSYVEEEKEMLRATLEGLINERSSYAIERCMATMFAGSPNALYRYGRLEDLDGIDRNNLANFHRQWLREAEAVIAVTGDVDSNEVQEAAAKFLSWQRQPQKLAPIRPLPPGDQVQRVTDRLPGEQSQLVVGITSGIAHDDPLTPAFIVLNGLLGAFGHSRLFRYLREEANLAYSASSRLDRSKGVILAKAGIDQSHADQAVEIIEQQLKALGQGEFTDQELSTTVGTILNNYRLIDDDPHMIMDYYVIGQLMGHAIPAPEMMESISHVSKDQVQEAAAQLRMDTIYLLAAEGGDHE